MRKVHFKIMAENNIQKTNNRNISLDITRIVAILMVVMIHISARFITKYETTSSEFIWANILDSISRIGVPLFVMISGALMLDENKNISTKKLLQKNIKNIAFLFIFWSAIYCALYSVIYPYNRGEELEYEQIIISFFRGYTHMWYLYMVIGLYIMTPFLRCIANRLNQRKVLLFIGISLAFQFTVPIIQALTMIDSSFKYLTELLGKFELDFFFGFTAYYLAGWYIVHIGIHKKWKKYCIYIASIISLLVVILYVQLTKDHSNGYSNMSIFIFMYSAGLFTFLNQGKNKKYNPKVQKLIITLSNMSFGVYIIHMIFRNEFERLVPYTEGSPLLYLMEKFCVVTIVSFAACFVLSKIPFVKRFVRM